MLLHILAIFIVTIASIDRVESSQGSETPRPCCFHQKGKGDLTFVDKDMKVYQLTYYKDYDNRRIIEVHSDDGPSPLLYLYRNFTTSKKYIRFRDGGGCRELPMIDEHIHCLPLDAEFRHTLRLEDGHNSGKFRQLVAWDFQSNMEFDGRVVDVTDGRCHPYMYRKKDSIVTYFFSNVVDGLEDDEFAFFDVDLSDCVA